jgi:hypothetical protein
MFSSKFVVTHKSSAAEQTIKKQNKHMKKPIVLLFVTFLFSLLFVSCKQKTIRTIEKVQNERVFLCNDTTKGAININTNIEIPVCYHNETVLDSIRNTIISQLFSPDYISYSNDSVLGFFVNDLVTDYKLNNTAMLNELDSFALYSFSNEHFLDGFSLLSDENIYSYGINRYVFMGGAHGLNSQIFMNFNLNTGKKIIETDIFTENYETELTEIIKNRIIEQSIEDSEIEEISDLEKTDYWVSNIKPNANFYISEDGINYVFNPYEIAPYYMGTTEVNIPFERIKPLLKPGSLINYLIYKD